jgi:hypothetical protein
MTMAILGPDALELQIDLMGGGLLVVDPHQAIAQLQIPGTYSRQTPATGAHRPARHSAPRPTPDRD